MPVHFQGDEALTDIAVGPKEVNEATDAKRPELNERLIVQLAEALWMPAAFTDEEKIARAMSTVALLRGIGPSDEIEGMLASQMVAAHSAAMECLRRTMLHEQTVSGRDMNLKHAAKLMQVYARQMDALSKHRGKGQQKVIVEHVHVEAGGQAVVGNFGLAGQKQKPDDQYNDGPKPVAFAPGKTLDMSVSAKVPVKKRTK